MNLEEKFQKWVEEGDQIHQEMKKEYEKLEENWNQLDKLQDELIELPILSDGLSGSSPQELMEKYGEEGVKKVEKECAGFIKWCSVEVLPDGKGNMLVTDETILKVFDSKEEFEAIGEIVEDLEIKYSEIDEEMEEKKEQIVEVQERLEEQMNFIEEVVDAWLEEGEEENPEEITVEAKN